MTISRVSRVIRPRSIRFGAALGAVGLAGVLALSACSSSGSASDAASPAPSGSAAGPGAAEGAPAFGGGGVSGEIAAISGTTLQVQDTESQTAVSYTADTAITRTVEGALSDVSAGVCVTAFTGGAPTTDGSAADEDDAVPDDGSAASVIITAAVDGTCSTGAFPGGGTRLDGAPDGFDGGTPPTDVPEGMTPPSDLPEGVMPTAPGDGAGGGAFGGLTTGLVTAVSGTGFTVEATAADGTVSTKEVTVDDSTAFTRTESTDATALVVGACVTAMGEADDKGSVAATSLAIEAAGADGCSAGFGARGPGGGAPGTSSTSGTSTSGSGS
ncbi:DUF5666 domain-containing protein [Herbiconiux sp. CPCC 205763]|uniref:DUF5666 domain-containing protein n=1 Tax=Herbiconiux aconitum TaxID=2970913 RepID=A0ABT2GLF6_9MICO|nr:DUF5666 domain-containing protein [Herbiconiux aconitum]MCS5717054.1 DUF5666 domain-containing protein [Herbiconiux aconitum]